MNTLMTDLWPFLVPTFIAAIGWQWRESYVLKTKVAVMEKTIEDILKTIESIQKRQDSHSKKQDEIVKLITDLKVDFTKELGGVSTSMGVMAANIDSLTNLIKVSDFCIKVDQNARNGK